MKILTILLFALTSLHVEAQISRETAQFQLGQLLPTDSVSVKIEYPEYEKLSYSAIKQLQKEGFKPCETIQFDNNLTYSRGNAVLDVSFVPVIKRNGIWLKLKNYEIKPVVSGVKVNNVSRLAIRTAAKVSTASRYADHSVLASGKWVKIRVLQEGIYSLTNEALANMGFADASKVKLYGYGGRLLPDKFTFTGSSSLIDDLCEVPLYRRNGSLLFFAEGLTNWTSDKVFQTNTFSQYSYYFLTESTGSNDAPATFPTLDAPSSDATSCSTVKAHALFDNDTYVWYGGGRDFYDDNELLSGHTFRLSLPGNVSSRCQVMYDISAQSPVSNTRLVITRTGSSNATVADTIITKYGEGETARGFRGSFTAALGTEESFKVQTSNTGRLNYLYTTYDQQLSTNYTTAAFTTGISDAVELNVSAANANTRVWQLGDAQSTVAELPGSLNGTTYQAKAADGSKRFVLVDLAGNYPSPEVVGTVANQDLHADAALDYIIVVPASGKLTAQAERLATAHNTKSGLRVKVVRADELYNEFSSGTPDAAAIRRYMKMLYDKAGSDEDAPRYLLLFGDCSYDNRMITADWSAASPDDYLLAYERNDQETYSNAGYSIGTMHSYVTDDYFGLLDDSEGASIVNEKIDLGIGRFLCHDEDNAKWLVDQAIGYLNNEHTGAWKNHYWALADAGDNNLHMTDAERVISFVESSAGQGILPRRIYIDSYNNTQTATSVSYPEATTKLKNTMKRGALIFNYNGHGSPLLLSHYNFIKNADFVENVSNTRPLWIFASCEITPYDQSTEDMGRTALFNKNGSAIAVLCASRSVYANYNRSLDAGFVHYAFTKDEQGNRYTMGDALRLTKGDLIRNTSVSIGTDRTINKLKYVLLGDPALALSYPDEGVRIDSINGMVVTSGNLTSLSVGNTVRFSGYVNADTTANQPDTSFNGTLHGTIFMPKKTITCKGYQITDSKTSPLTYTDYTQTLFDGDVEVKNGRFTFELMVPRGATFSTERAKLLLYALSTDKQKEYNGSYDDFCINSSSSTADTDSVGPNIYMYLNTPDFPAGGTVGTDATLYASIQDSSSVSMLSGSLGHDMEMWLDDDASTLTAVNDYFTFDYGSYSTGLLEYPLSGLSEGKHTLKLRVWDAFDNFTVSYLPFNVNANGVPEFDVTLTSLSGNGTARFITSFTASENGSTVQTEVFNISGQRVWHCSDNVEAGTGYKSFDWDYTNYAGAPLDNGVYLYRSKVDGKNTKTKKYVIVR